MMALCKLNLTKIWNIWFLLLLTAYICTCLSLALAIKSEPQPNSTLVSLLGLATCCMGFCGLFCAYTHHVRTQSPPSWPCWILVIYLTTNNWITSSSEHIRWGCISALLCSSVSGLLATICMGNIFKCTLKTFGTWLILFIVYIVFAAFTMWNQWKFSSSVIIIASSFFILFIYHYVTRQPSTTRLMASMHGVYIGLVCIYPVLFCENLYCQAVTLAASITIFNIGSASVIIATHFAWKTSGKGTATYIVLQGLVLFLYIMSAEMIIYETTMKQSMESPGMYNFAENIFLAGLVVLTVLQIWQGYHTASVTASVMHGVLSVLTSGACAVFAVHSNGWLPVALATIVCIALLISASQIVLVIYIHKYPRKFILTSGESSHRHTTLLTRSVHPTGRTAPINQSRPLPPVPHFRGDVFRLTPLEDSSPTLAEGPNCLSTPITPDTSESREQRDHPQSTSFLLGNRGVSSAPQQREQIGGAEGQDDYEAVDFPTH
ncbi:membrane protein K15 [Colobine gammaherpesvirus 1]|uniref:Membrane protein K15 n=1 Tax=Colobine gammaherpesvirus 1 TaxID=2597325 RepID=A0A5B8G933_9GAMA|nr:membrane protein K15 [Colobine gammaherpesvirus 1]QDQ69288.1 membrane protein K15 [Colobine gammaherpesvirus 1]